MELMQIPIHYEGDLDILLNRIQTIDNALGLSTQSYSKLSSIALELASNAISGKNQGEITFDIEFDKKQTIHITISYRIKVVEAQRKQSNEFFRYSWLRSFNSHVNIIESNSEQKIICHIPELQISETIDQTSLDELIQVLKYSEEDSLFNKTKEDLINDLKDRSKNIREKNLEIEELYRYQEQQKQLIDKIREADKMKTQFLANMSHELRTPLNSIIGFSELLEDGLVGDLTDEQLDVLKDILNSARHLLDLINRILDISKIEAGMMELNYIIIDFSQIVNDVSTQLTPLLQAKHIELVREIPYSLMINCDELRLKQILINLLSNAIKFSNEESKITIGANIDEEFVIIVVKDEGIGMRDTDLDKIFQEFTQVDESHTRAYQGTGLGLSLVKKLVELHGGSIWVESQFGEGSSFYFTLPISVK